MMRFAVYFLSAILLYSETIIAYSADRLSMLTGDSYIVYRNKLIRKSDPDDQPKTAMGRFVLKAIDIRKNNPDLHEQLDELEGVALDIQTRVHVSGIWTSRLKESEISIDNKLILIQEALIFSLFNYYYLNETESNIMKKNRLIGILFDYILMRKKGESNPENDEMFYYILNKYIKVAPSMYINMNIGKNNEEIIKVMNLCPYSDVKMEMVQEIMTFNKLIFWSDEKITQKYLDETLESIRNRLVLYNMLLLTHKINKEDDMVIVLLISLNNSQTMLLNYEAYFNINLLKRTNELINELKEYNSNETIVSHIKDYELTKKNYQTNLSDIIEQRTSNQDVIILHNALYPPPSMSTTGNIETLVPELLQKSESRNEDEKNDETEKP